MDGMGRVWEATKERIAGKRKWNWFLQDWKGEGDHCISSSVIQYHYFIVIVFENFMFLLTTLIDKSKRTHKAENYEGREKAMILLEIPVVTTPFCSLFPCIIQHMS